jgi:hypothetical protein
MVYGVFCDAAVDAKMTRISLLWIFILSWYGYEFMMAEEYIQERG